jgi:hypothetical protein
MHTPHACKPGFFLNKPSHYGKRVREFLFTLHKNSVPTAHRTQCALNGLMLCKEIILLTVEITLNAHTHTHTHAHTHTHTYTLRAQKTVL